MKKGSSLPINVVIVLIIAIIVLVGIVVFFGGAFGESSTSLSCESKLQNGCTQFNLAGGCNDLTHLTTSDVEDMKNLKEGLECTGFDATLDSAKKMCCPGTGTATTV